MMMETDKIKNIKFTVLGAGRSGIGISKLLKKSGALVLLSDSSKKEVLLYLNEQVLMDFGIEYELGGNSDRIFNAEYIITSPGIAPGSDVLVKAKAKGIKIVSEVEAASWFCNVPIIAITGTNGKTTTTELTGTMLRDSGFDVHVCGNVGLAFSEIIPDLKSDSIVVLEVSSFQLEFTDTFRPMVSAILNITSDHIDWHGSLGLYAEAKYKVNKNQKDDDLIIINYDDITLKNRVSIFNATVGTFSVNSPSDDFKYETYTDNDSVCYKHDTEEVIINKEEIFLRGTHNVMNSMAAIMAVKKFGVSNDSIKKTLMNFKGVEHRIETVRELEGVKYYNDSKATNYDSLYVALESFKCNIILIMGGKKGVNNFEIVDPLIKERVKFICAIGQSREAISEHYKDTVMVKMFDEFSDAVKHAKNIAKPGDFVLFSPGYKSFDMFQNFEHRGEVFKQIVNEL
ncbi:MAG: UDP-N-acetylmuramoyl-L-alanine--D-glutamate ligase [Ignavibacteriae bacterium]|nr:UDP-N-acetylmuramoyl-L-alanine--D-glutamate ligase [Ignavibacteriota bacterium]